MARDTDLQALSTEGLHRGRRDGQGHTPQQDQGAEIQHTEPLRFGSSYVKEASVSSGDGESTSCTLPCI